MYQTRPALCPRALAYFVPVSVLFHLLSFLYDTPHFDPTILDSRLSSPLDRITVRRVVQYYAATGAAPVSVLEEGPASTG